MKQFTRKSRMRATLRISETNEIMLASRMNPHRMKCWMLRSTYGPRKQHPTSRVLHPVRAHPAREYDLIHVAHRHHQSRSALHCQFSSSSVITAQLPNTYMFGLLCTLFSSTPQDCRTILFDPNSVDLEYLLGKLKRCPNLRTT